MYESPIKIIKPIDFITQQITHQINETVDNQIYEAVLKVGIEVDKEELIKALQYDRGQYEQGFLDGVRNANARLVLCQECKQWSRNVGISDSPNGHCWYHDTTMNGYGFCSCGERKESND